MATMLYLGMEAHKDSIAGAAGHQIIKDKPLGLYTSFQTKPLPQSLVQWPFPSGPCVFLDLRNGLSIESSSSALIPSPPALFRPIWSRTTRCTLHILSGLHVVVISPVV